MQPQNFSRKIFFVAQPNEVVVQNVVLGINASDINFTAGRYFSDQKSIKLPFDCGFESLGKVVHVGSAVKRVKKGDYVLISGTGTSFPSMKYLSTTQTRHPTEKSLTYLWGQFMEHSQST